MKLMDQSIVNDFDFTDISAQNYDQEAVSHSRSNSSEDQMLRQLKMTVSIHYEIASIEKTIEAMNVTDRQNYLAHILKYQYINGWTVTKCCQKLYDNFPKFAGNNGFGTLPESTFHDHQKEALLAFATIYKSGSLLVRKKFGAISE